MSSNLALSPSSASPSSSSSSRSSHLHRRSCLSSPSSPSFLKLGTRSRTPRTILTVRSHASADGTGGSKQSSDPMDGCTVTSSAIDFLTLCHSLKTTKRKGWINHGIKGPESIADHMYRMALMALIAGDLPGVNRERCIKIAIVHDIAEAIVGDITPSDGVPKEEKHRREQAALNEMCKVLGGGMRAEEIKELWAEYENNSSIEANLVKDFDKTKLESKLIESRMVSRPMKCESYWTLLYGSYSGNQVFHDKKTLMSYCIMPDVNSESLGHGDVWRCVIQGKIDNGETAEEVTTCTLHMRVRSRVYAQSVNNTWVINPKEFAYCELVHLFFIYFGMSVLKHEVEMILQALEYETEHGKVLDEFFLSTAGKFQTEIGRTWAAEVTSRRNMRLSNRFN